MSVCLFTHYVCETPFKLLISNNNIITSAIDIYTMKEYSQDVDHTLNYTMLYKHTYGCYHTRRPPYLGRFAQPMSQLVVVFFFHCHTLAETK